MLEQSFRPWGRWEVIDEVLAYKVKKLYIDPNKAISLQYHNHRSEAWSIVEGAGEVILDDKKFQVKQGDTFVVPVRCVHKITNTTKAQLIIVEVQCGEIVKEDDIVRLGQ